MKKLEDYKWMCPQPFTHIYKNIGGHNFPCCQIKNWYTPLKALRRRGDGSSFNWDGLSLEEYHNTPLNKIFQKEFLTGDGPLIRDCCTRCLDSEKNDPNKNSPRRNYLKQFIKGNMQHRKIELEEYLESDMKEPLIMSMEYKVKDNYCNLKCNFCASVNSSSLAGENIELKKLGHTLSFPHQLPRRHHNKAHVKDEEDFSRLDNVLKTLSYLELVGGETLAIPQNYELLDHIIDLGVSKNIAVKITTNGTILPKINGKTIFDYIPHFKKISFLVSIEFWGAKNDYLRYGSKWNVILNNALKLTEHGCKVSYHSTVNALNAGYLDEMPMKQSYGGVVKGKGQIYSIASIPLDIRKKYMEGYDYNKLCLHWYNIFKNLQGIKQDD